MDGLDDVFIFEYFYRYETSDSSKPKTVRKLRGVSGGNFKPPCSCMQKCYEKISNDYRQKLFDTLQKLSRHGQKEFLSNHMQVHSTVRRKVEDSRRSFSRFYFFPIASGPVKVCKLMFMNTFDITDRKIRDLAALKDVDDVVTQKRKSNSAEYITGDNIGEDIRISETLEKQLLGGDIEIVEQHGSNVDKDTHTENVSDADVFKYMQPYQSNESSSRSNNLLEKAIQRWRKNRGYSYTRPNGVEVPARQLKPACTCQMLCYKKFSTESRQRILDKLLKLSSSCQNRFLASHFKIIATKRQTTNEPFLSKRQFSYIYYLPVEGGVVKVCKIMYLNTFDIRGQKIRMLASNMDPAENMSFNEIIRKEQPQQVLADYRYEMDSTIELSCSDEEVEHFEELNHYPMTLDVIDDGILENFEADELVINDYETKSIEVHDKAYPMLQELYVTDDNEQQVDANVANYMQRYEIDKCQVGSSSRQRCKERGSSYIRLNGSEVPARQLKVACTCLKLCYAKITNKSRQKLLDNLLKLSFRGQNNFLSSHMRVMATKRPTKYDSRRHFSYIYYIPVEAGVMKVCKLMFMNTFDIGDKKIRLLAQKKKCDGLVIMDESGVAHEVMDDTQIALRFESNDSYDEDFSELDYNEDKQTNIEEKIYNDENFEERQEIKNLFHDYFKRYETDFPLPFCDHSYFRQNDLEVQPEQLKPACTCEPSCYDKISAKSRQGILDSFLKLSASCQKKLLASHFKIIANDPVSNRHLSYIYFLPVEGGIVEVCKAMYLNTFDIEENEIFMLAASIDPGHTMICNKIESEEQHQQTLTHDNQQTTDCTIKLLDDDISLVANYEEIQHQPMKLEVVDNEICEYLKIEIDELIIDDHKTKPTGEELEIPAEAYPMLQEIQLNDAKEQLVGVNVANYMQRYEVDKCQVGSSRQQEQRRRKEQGLSYIRINGSEAPPRQLKESCACRKMCYIKIPNKSRLKLLENLLKLSFRGQNYFLSSHMKVMVTKRPRISSSKRQFSHVYYIPVEAGLMKVCKLMFMNTFDIGGKKIRVLALKKSCDGLLILDENGVGHELMDNIQIHSKCTDKNGELDCDEDEEEKASNDGSHEEGEESDDFFLYDYFNRYEIDGSHNKILDYPGKKLSKSAKRKRRKERGYSYISHDGRVIPARELKSACSCPRRCYAKITDTARKKLLRSLLKLSFIGQQEFLSCHMQVHAAVQPEVQRRMHRYFFLPRPTGLLKVCMVMFMNTFDITYRRLRTIYTKKVAAERLLLEEDNITRPIKELSYPDNKESQNPVNKLESAKYAVEANPSREARNIEMDLIERAARAERLDRKERGLSFIRRNGMEAPARRVKPACQCRLRCYEKVTDDVRQQLLADLLTRTAKEQKTYLIDLLHQAPTLNPRRINSRRSFTFLYYLPVESKHVRVCCRMFISTFDITLKKLRTLLNIKCSESLDHTYTSHTQNIRASQIFKYRTSSITDMYRLYVRQCNKLEKRPMCFATYSSVQQKQKGVDGNSVGVLPRPDITKQREAEPQNISTVQTADEDINCTNVEMEIVQIPLEENVGDPLEL
ncbi:uncharacterized protein LOC131689897 isoform X2 [Topomyia yanbarensis]|uniref:uncharacterized protein LOC131689897 isoform X2 n=1 Tax=Topomyia yanbarensis TaxID=2498891 RepID=UPI00273CA1EE|nr:uncharacterized protein LOC131689897 isoform X2 [Topomyia yanbarensis]